MTIKFYVVNWVQVLRLDFSARIIIIFFLTAAFTGVVGNRTDDLFVRILPALSREITIEIGWLFFWTAWAVGLPSVLAARNRVALRDVSNLNKIGDNLASHILSLYTPISDRSMAQERARTVAKSIFRDIVKDRPFDTCGIAIYLPNSRQDCLNAWEWYSTPNHASNTIKFHIGSNAVAKGIVGTTFIDGKTRVVQFGRDGSANTNLYLPSDNGRTSYRSFICQAISGSVPTDSGVELRKLGVLCLYSDSRSTFNSSGIKTNVESLAYRFSVVLMSFLL